MNEEYVLYVGGKKYFPEDESEEMPRKPEPEEMKWLTPAPRKMSRWVSLWLLAKAGHFRQAVYGWLLACLCVSLVTDMPGCLDVSLSANAKFVLLLFAVAGLIFTGRLLIRGERNRRLLKNGEIGKGKVLKFKVAYHKRKAVWKRVTYQFTAEDGRTHEASAYLPPYRFLNDTAYQVLFYDRNAPRYILPYAGVAKEISPDAETGEFRVASAETYIRTVVMLAIHLGFFTVLVLQMGVFFGG